MQPHAEPGAYLTLDAMRGVGAMLVVIGHCFIFWAGFWMPNGFPIVDMFFLFSGFVIAFAYEPRFKAGMSAGQFLLQRVVRLYPLYFAGFVMGAFVFLAIVYDRGPAAIWAYFGQLVPQIFILPSPDVAGTGTFFQFNGPAWTLFFELLANAVYILAWPWLKSTRVLAVVVALSGLWLVLATLAAGNIDMGPTWRDYWGGFARVSFSFFGGVLLYRLKGSPKAVRTRVTWRAIVPIALLPIIVLPGSTKELRPWLELFTAMILSPTLVWWASTLTPPRCLWKICALLGGMSYAMYILHYPIFIAMQRLAWRATELSTAWAPWTGVAILAAVFIVAVAAENYYDKPVRRWIVQRLRMRAATRAAARAQAQPADAGAAPTFAE
jgi:peptidoglycan/LPS O-acetylase OafA/YrhL